MGDKWENKNGKIKVNVKLQAVASALFCTKLRSDGENAETDGNE